jgi:hypothetical protein
MDSSTLLKSALMAAVSAFTSFESLRHACMIGCENARKSVPLASKRSRAPGLRASFFAKASEFANAAGSAMMD